MNSVQRLENWALNEMKNVVDDAIIQVDQYSLVAFNRYRITREQGRYAVDTGSDRNTFGSSRTAISYCILDRAGRADWCIHLRQLDERRTRLSDDIRAREQIMYRSQNNRMRDVVIDKLASKRAALDSVNHQLDKYVIKAKYLQHQGFANETARTRRA